MTLLAPSVTISGDGVTIHIRRLVKLSFAPEESGDASASIGDIYMRLVRGMEVKIRDLHIQEYEKEGPSLLLSEYPIYLRESESAVTSSESPNKEFNLKIQD